MDKLIDCFKKQSGTWGISVHSAQDLDRSIQINELETYPLASAGKVAMGYGIAKLVEEGEMNWDDVVSEVKVDPREDSEQLYPHWQRRDTLQLRQVVEGMIACHDVELAKACANQLGGFSRIQSQIDKNFLSINVTEDPRDEENRGQLVEIAKLVQTIYNSYQQDPDTWEPVIQGMVRMQDKHVRIPYYHQVNMTGGLPGSLIEISVLGAFQENPYIVVIAAKGLENREEADRLVDDIMYPLYNMWKNKKDE
ncbi:serine hydrolase [Pontibacillus marinus]|uniref:Membrane protein n=1 Tax=Pontibacillus marinus BH030004 = DSM 16465 TaxID=1385511 RepID=A0A0A5HXE1_9BACI|nr:class A beta-lactamase [Pontibacillus marinus]KGX88292.1 membrane protein [Pontibacillus marinus BH030004 = DSM 16465]